MDKYWVGHELSSWYRVWAWQGVWVWVGHDTNHRHGKGAEKRQDGSILGQQTNLTTIMVGMGGQGRARGRPGGAWWV